MVNKAFGIFHMYKLFILRGIEKLLCQSLFLMLKSFRKMKEKKEERKERRKGGREGRKEEGEPSTAWKMGV